MIPGLIYTLWIMLSISFINFLKHFFFWLWTWYMFIAKKKNKGNTWIMKKIKTYWYPLEFKVYSSKNIFHFNVKEWLVDGSANFAVLLSDSWPCRDGASFLPFTVTQRSLPRHPRYGKRESKGERKEEEREKGRTDLNLNTLLNEIRQNETDSIWTVSP